MKRDLGAPSRPKLSNGLVLPAHTPSAIKQHVPTVHPVQRARSQTKPWKLRVFQALSVRVDSKIVPSAVLDLGAQLLLENETQRACQVNIQQRGWIVVKCAQVSLSRCLW